MTSHGRGIFAEFIRKSCTASRLAPAVLFLLVLLAGTSARAADLTGSGSASVVSGDSYAYVYGTRSQGGDAVANDSLVTVSGGAVSMDLYGGSALSRNGSAEAMNNRVTVSGGLSGFNDNIYGGYARSYTSGVMADGNSVTLEGSLRFGPWVQVFGGYARMSGGSGFVEALDNHVNVGGSAALDWVVGGYAYAESSARGASLAEGNTLSLNGGAASLMYGGYAVAQGDATARNNVVSINGGLFGNVVGGEVHSYKGKALAEGNTVTITGGEGSSTVVGASVQSDSGSAEASGNTVSVFNASVAGNVSGAFAPESSVPTSLVGNRVVIGSGATVAGDAVGGAVTGATPGSRADSNIVAVADGGRVDGDVIGGLAEAEDSSASYNTVLVRNASVGGSIYGGEAGAGSTATHNSIIMGTGATLAADTSLYGGWIGGAPVASAGSGNTLFVDSWQGRAARVTGFENLHFVLPTPGAPVEVPMLTVTGAQEGDFVGSTVTAQLPDIITGGRAYLGNTFMLISDASGAVRQASAGRLVSLLQGYATYFDGVLENSGTAVQLRLEEMRMNPRIAALTEARAATAGLLNQGGDLAADTGMRHAREAADSEEDEEWHPFAAVYGGTARHHTGSRADTEGFSGMTGLTGSFRSGSGRALLGGFFEFGRAHLDTFNGFVSGDVNGQGDSRYTGVGLLARYDLTSGPLAGLYAEGAARFGNVETDWHSGDLRDNMDRPAEYELSMPYYGVHVGVGHVLSLADVVQVDTYGKFFWTHQGSDRADMNGEIVNFDDVDSRRLRLGVRLDLTAFENMTPYVGAAWEHEYSGTARAVARDFSIPDASLEGDSGVFELGLAVEPSFRPLTLDLALVGSTGERESLGGHLSVLYRF